MARTTSPSPAKALSFEVPSHGSVSALLQRPVDSVAPRALFVFAHGAGAGMNHAFMSAVADGLAQRGIASLRYQFPYMERGSQRVDPPAVAQATVRSAVDEAAQQYPGIPLIAGGKSFGARMTSSAQAESPLPGVRGLLFLGFPLHPAGKPAITRAVHLDQVSLPMLFLQGDRDELADLVLLQPRVRELPTATLQIVAGADHAFHVLKRSGRTDDEVVAQMLDASAAWIASIE